MAFPDAIDTFRDIENIPGLTYEPTDKRTLFVEDVQQLRDALITLENVLGLDILGQYDDLNARLEDDEIAISGKEPSLGFTAENSANKKTTLADNSDTYYPSQKAVKTAVDAKQNSLGYTAESTANKKTSLADNSDTYYPSQKAVKTAVDAKQNSLGFTAEDVANKDTTVTLGVSDTKYPSQNAVKNYVDGLLAASDAVVYKGVIDCSANPNYPAADAGHLYMVSVAGKIGGASGDIVTAGDMLICKTDGTAAGTKAAVGANWNIIQTNITYTAEDVANKDSTNTLGTSDTKYPTQKAVKDYVDTAIANAKSALMPVGTIYSNETDSTNPGTLFGFGTWVAVAGYSLGGYKSGDANYGTPGANIGAASVTLTAAQSGLVNHAHTIVSGPKDSAWAAPYMVSSYHYQAAAPINASTINGSGSASASEAHTNLPPIRIVYIWKRTA